MIETSAAETPLPWVSRNAPPGLVGVSVVQTDVLGEYGREAQATQALWVQLARARWLDEWVRLGTEALRDAPPGPSARELLIAGRARLEQK